MAFYPTAENTKAERPGESKEDQCSRVSFAPVPPPAYRLLGQQQGQKKSPAQRGDAERDPWSHSPLRARANQSQQRLGSHVPKKSPAGNGKDPVLEVAEARYAHVVRCRPWASCRVKFWQNVVGTLCSEYVRRPVLQEQARGGREMCQATGSNRETGFMSKQHRYECPNSKCKSAKLIAIGQDPKNKNRSGEPQFIYRCPVCGWSVGETSLEPRHRR